MTVIDIHNQIAAIYPGAYISVGQHFNGKQTTWDCCVFSDQALKSPIICIPCETSPTVMVLRVKESKVATC